MQVNDLTKILKKEHQGKWVVYSPSQGAIFSAASSMKRAIAEAKNISCKDKRLLRVPLFNQVLIPSKRLHS